MLRGLLGRETLRYYEELEGVALRAPGRLGLRFAGAGEVLVRMTDAESLAARLSAVVEGPERARAGVRDLTDLREVLAAWLGLPGFCAAPFVRFVLEAGVALDASDLHWEPTDEGYRLCLRRFGELREVGRVPRGVGQRVVGRLKVLAGALVHRVDIVQEGRVDLAGPGTDVRLSFVPTVRGESVTARLFDRLKGGATLAGLGFDATLREGIDALTAGPGVVVFAGASASGKTTTLYTTLRELMARMPDRRVVTIEDPVECRLDGATQLEVDAARGNTYAALLRSVLRQDAEVLVVGEVRDEETAALALRAGLTGHLVLTTLHAGSVDEVRRRLRDLGADAETMAQAVRGVVAQRLEPTRGEAGEVVGRSVRAVLERWRGDAPGDDELGADVGRGAPRLVRGRERAA